jgi:hypothetical protein
LEREEGFEKEKKGATGKMESLRRDGFLGFSCLLNIKSL